MMIKLQSPGSSVHGLGRTSHETPRLAAILSTAISLLLIAQTAALELAPRVVGSWPGFKRDPNLDVKIEGDFAYVLSYSHLHVLNISNAASPVRLGGYDISPELNLYSPHTLAVSGEYAFILSERNVQVIDFTNPKAPRGIASVGFTNSFPLDLALSGTNAFLVDTVGLRVLDISNLADPQTVATLKVNDEYPYDVAVSQNYAFVAAANAMGAVLRIFDVRNPSAPEMVGVYHTDELRYGPFVAISATHAYLLAESLHIIDIRNPANPQKVGGYEFPPGDNFRTRTLALSPDSPHAYVLTTQETSGGRVEIIDISNPATPRRAGGFSTEGAHPLPRGEGAHQSIAASRGVVYLAGAKPDLEIVDVSNAGTPRELNNTAIGDWSLDVAVSGNYAYVAEGDAGLQIIDIAQPAHLRRVAHLPARASGVIVSGTKAYVLGEGLQILDMSDPVRPQPLGSYPLDSSYRFTVHDARAYVIVSQRVTEAGHLPAELVILDITEPANPHLLGRYISEGFPTAVAVHGNYAWLAEQGTLNVIDITDPRSPTRVHQELTDGAGFLELSCSENFLYGLYRGELRVIDIRRPKSPVLLSTYRPDLETGISPHGIGGCDDSVDPTDRVDGLGLLVSGDRAYLAWGLGLCSLEGTALDVVDISAPTNPRHLGTLRRHFCTPNPHWRERKSRMTLSGDHIFMADRNAGLQVITAATPQAARFEQIVREPTGAVRFRISGPPGTPCRLQRSTDLKSWSDWRSVEFLENGLELSDLNSPAFTGFYRIAVP